MNAFDKVAGYEDIKSELLQVCDMIKNKDAYDRLGAHLPRGVLLYGAPGLGKTLMAQCFIEESGLKAYTVRCNMGNGDFIKAITATFEEAKKNAPAIVFLDDMDKFANEDNDRPDAAEYMAVQSGIDEVKDTGVFVLATANNIRKLPESLVRSGRFDRRFDIEDPSEEDSEKIIAYYLKDKANSDDVNLIDLTKMISYSSCAELETILNEAAIHAASARKDAIEMEDLVDAVLRIQHSLSDVYPVSRTEERRKVALHEAGHLVVSEALQKGNVGMAVISADAADPNKGFVRYCTEFERRPHQILASLAGKAAVELYYADTVASGCQRDILKAVALIRDGIEENGTCGLHLLPASAFYSETSEKYKAEVESVVQAELERYMRMTKDVLLKNRAFLEACAKALDGRGILLYSDIRKLCDLHDIVEIAV